MSLPAELAYLFRHALLREAAYQLHLPSDRASLHRLVLEIVDEVLASATEEVRNLAALEMAEHARLGSEDKALPAAAKRALIEREFEFLRRAANHLRAQHQLEAAAVVLRRMGTHAAAGPEARISSEVELARLRATAGHSIEAEVMVRRLIPELEVQGKVREADELRHDLVQLLASMGKIEECENVSRLAVEAAEKRNDRRTRLLFEFSLLRCLRLEGKWEEAVTKTEACVKTAHDLGDFKTGCSLLYFLSALHSDLLQDKQSLAALKRAKELAESQGDPYLNALFTGSEGMMLRDIGQAAKGEPLLRTAVKYFAESGYKRMESSFLGGLASVQFNLKRYRDAQETAQAALRIAADAGNLRELHAAQGLVGISLTMAGQFQEGLSMLNVAAATAKASNDQVYAATWSGHGAIALLAMGNHAGCVERMRSVMSAFNALGRKESAEMLNKQLREHAHDLKLSLPTSL